MADFTPAFGQDGERRLPTETEKEQGFLCGPADRALFTGLFHRLESEVGDVIEYAGLSGDNTNNTQLREAILALIDAATGGNPAGYILETQARSRYPFYPEVTNSDGRIVITSPATGQVRLPGGVNFLHRGIGLITTVQTDFATDPSKTYHLRWDPTNGFRLRDLASAGYNPTALVEANALFDTVYDDMLIARVITNSSNVPTIVNLANKHRLVYESAEIISDAASTTYGTPNDALIASAEAFYNFARTPLVFVTAAMLSSHSARHQGVANWLQDKQTTRYKCYALIQNDYDADIMSDAAAHGRFRFQAII